MIDSIRLQNFMAFSDQAFDFAPLTVLTGENSAGKSSLLHALALLRQSYSANSLSDHFVLNSSLVELGTGRDVLHSDFGDLSDFSGNGIAIELNEGSLLYRYVAEYQNESDVLPVVVSPTSDLVETSLFRPGFQYLKADRIVPSVTYPKSHESVHIDRSLGGRGEHTANFLRVHGDHQVENLSRNELAVSPSLIDQVNGWLAEISVGTQMSVEDIPGADLVRLSFTRRGSDVKSASQRATNVGFGLTYCLPIITACLVSEEGQVLLIENPEAHLHPSGQAIIGRLISSAARRGVQIVVETHSDHILNSFRLEVKNQRLVPEDLVFQYFSRRESALSPSCEKVGVESNGSITRWPRGFFDQIDDALVKLVSP